MSLIHIAVGAVVSKPRRHLTYVLSLWQAQTKGKPTWRAWLSRPATGERRGFATLDELFSFLKTRASLLGRESNGGPESTSGAGESSGLGSADEPPTAPASDHPPPSFSATRRNE